ncbi:uncharacterized protein LOC134242727 [Saccostrea cucullata]|uniref:uncharacterized protein LOC134242727 n=1 Tax=Saccostrea cuccullata TaxID=36930 RepID=UPI002ED46050
MSADDSFNSDSDNSLPEPINEIDSGEENDQRDCMGVRPYHFEPRRADSVSGVRNSAAQDSTQVREEEDLSWCTCGTCQPIEGPDNRFCCQECDKTKAKINEGNELTKKDFICITSHPGFQSVCLDPWVLETAYYAYRQDWGRIQKPQHQ